MRVLRDVRVVLSQGPCLFFLTLPPRSEIAMSGGPFAQDESAFMEELLLGIDSSFFDSGLSPDPSPRKRKRASCEPPDPQITSTRTVVGRGPICTPTKKKSRQSHAFGEADLASLFEGAENWDWDEGLSPVRSKPSVSAFGSIHCFKCRVFFIQTNVYLAPPEDDEKHMRCVVESIEHCGSTKVWPDNNSRIA